MYALAYVMAILPLALVPIFSFVAPLSLLAWRIPRLCQHKGPVYLSGQLFGSCYFGSITVVFLFENAFFINIPWYGYPLLGVASVAAGAITGLNNLFIRFVCTSVRFVLLEQDGTLCSWCGYPVGMAKSDACSECGTPSSTPTKPHGLLGRAAARLERRLRVAMGALLILLLSGPLLLVWHHWPYWDFVRTFSSGDNVSTEPVVARWGGPLALRAGLKTYRELPDDTSRALILRLHRPEYFAAPLMQIRLGGRWTPPRTTSTSVFARDGKPRIICNLDANQTRHVMEYGVPPSLIDALLRKSDAVHWQPPQPGVWEQSYDVELSGKGHFPSGSENGQVRLIDPTSSPCVFQNELSAILKERRTRPTVAALHFVPHLSSLTVHFPR